MNENLVIEAVHDTIEAAKDSLVDNITHQGQQREIKEILRSILTAPKQPYTITINVSTPEERFQPSANTSRGSSIVIYPVELHITDYAFPQPEDTEAPFETMHYDFRLLVDRLVKLIKDDTTRFVSGSGKFVLREGSNVRVDNRTQWYDTQQVSFPLFYSVILFSLVDYCADSSLLE